MKKLILAVLLTVSAYAAELVLSTSSSTGGVTKTVTVGRVQADPAADGSVTLSVIPREVITLADGTVVSDRFVGEWLSVKLSDKLVSDLNAEITAAKVAADKAKADAAAAAAKATP